MQKTVAFKYHSQAGFNPEWGYWAGVREASRSAIE